MAQNSLADCLLLINQQIASREVLLEQHLKVDALLEIILGGDLLIHRKVVLHHYLWTISDIMHVAKDNNEQFLNALIFFRTSLVSDENKNNWTVH